MAHEGVTAIAHDQRTPIILSAGSARYGCAMSLGAVGDLCAGSSLGPSWPSGTGRPAATPTALSGFHGGAGRVKWRVGAFLSDAGALGRSTAGSGDQGAIGWGLGIAVHGLVVGCRDPGTAPQLGRSSRSTRF